MVQRLHTMGTILPRVREVRTVERAPPYLHVQCAEAALPRVFCLVGQHLITAFSL